VNEFTRRVLFAIPAAALFLWMTWLGDWPFRLMMGALALMTVWEMSSLFEPAGPDASKAGTASRVGYRSVSMALALAVLAAGDLDAMPGLHMLTGRHMLTGLFLLWVGMILLQAWRWRMERVRFGGLTAVLCGLYAPLAFRLAIDIRQSGLDSDASHPSMGFMLVLSVLLSVWGNDVFAYLGGKRFGRHKLAPSWSPGKTWEGFASGFIGAALGFGIVAALAPTVDSGFPDMWRAFWPIPLLASLFGPVGDLMESRLKRFKGVKDSGRIFPGHGGVFDRFDALILTVPMVWAYLRWLA
jgi:phosphatidate cytidylyltransferase